MVVPVTVGAADANGIALEGPYPVAAAARACSGTASSPS